MLQAQRLIRIPTHASCLHHRDLYAQGGCLSNMNPKKHLLYVDAYTCMTWTDPRLKWDAEKFGGLNMVRLRASEIWVPKVVVMAFVDLSPRSDSVALASPGGGVAYCPVHPVHAACKTDMTHFPFDRHECIVEFTNFIDTESNVNLTVGTKPGGPEGRVRVQSRLYYHHQ
ncbi:hypothetical protein HPB47_022143, partial [Ixodes persulcatus]